MTDKVDVRTEAPVVPAGSTKTYHLETDAAGNVGIKNVQEVNNSANLEFEPFERLREVEVAEGRKLRLPLREAMLWQPDAANILRADIRLLAFNAFNANSRTFEGFTDIMQSNRKQEEYLRDAAIGVIPRAPSGTQAPRMKTDFEGGVTIDNHLYRYLVPILGDYIRFDEIGKVKQLAMEMGLSGRMTEEWAVYSYITTTGNYGRADTTKDNDVGANQQTLTFDADGLRTAKAIISTSKDRKSGAYLGYNADTLIITPQLEVPAMQLLTSMGISRTHGVTTAEVIGTGTTNPMVGFVSKIIVAPWLGADYEWALCDSRRQSFKFQVVEPFDVFQQTLTPSSESWLSLDEILYLVKGYFGVGFVDDRAWFFSDSTTDATVS
jgi:hypothetical protein